MDRLYQELAASPAWMCQAKLNGRRAIWDGEVLWSRQGNRLTVKAASALTGFATSLDGEFLNDTFYPFDIADSPLPLEERWKVLRWVVQEIASPFVQLCPLAGSWEDVANNGWEGVVFKKKASLYHKAMRDGVTTPDWVKYRAEWL